MINRTINNSGNVNILIGDMTIAAKIYSAPGGKKLEYDLKDTIKSILQPAVVS